MSVEDVLDFLKRAREDTAMLARYNQRNLSELLFHAKNEGFDFTAENLADVAGKLEASVILEKDHDPFDETSRLWREMWGRISPAYLGGPVGRRHSAGACT